MFWNSQKSRIYLDYASATPVRKEGLTAMTPFFSDVYGNAGAIHKEGVHAKHVIAGVRERLARVLHVRPQGIVFTGSGTESNNLAIIGVVEALHTSGRAYADMEIISTQIEHPSVMEVLAHLVARGVHVTYVQVDECGRIDANNLRQSVTAKTVLVTFAYVNSEIGTVQAVGKLARIVREKEKEYQTRIVVHVDGAQAPLWLPCSLDSLNVDMISLDAGKCYGPKGVGVLAMIHGVSIAPHLFGGGQERGLRPGTENTALIVGAVESLCIAQDSHTTRSETITKMRDAFIKKLESIGGVILNGAREERVANNVNISIAGIDSEFAVISLDEKGIACATKSACGGAKGDGSAVVRAISNDDSRARSTIRFSLGEATTQKELDYTVEVLKAHITKTRTALAGLTKS